MTKIMISLLMMFLLLAAPSILAADEVLSGSTTEWLQDTIESDEFDMDGCRCS